MPNPYFRFKQFTVKQDKCAMKVCTDACLFGAWAAALSLQQTAHNLLDIGAGTGLLSLMLAQQLPGVLIDAIEIDDAAASQAKENFADSPWQERLKVYHTSIQEFAADAKYKYDIIIANPPFYENDLKGNNAQRNLAMHSSGLKLEELIEISNGVLKDDGLLFILLPYNRTEQLRLMVRDYYSIKEIVLVKQTPKHPYFRSMVLLQKIDCPAVVSTITITDESGGYSNKFVELLKDFYLKL